MTRFETPGQVLLLFTGVAVITVVLMALLNVEANKRKVKGRRSPFWLHDSTVYGVPLLQVCLKRDTISSPVHIVTWSFLL
jgi:hypothetical protein